METIRLAIGLLSVAGWLAYLAFIIYLWLVLDYASTNPNKKVVK
jgi:hypothetical protein